MLGSTLLARVFGRGVSADAPVDKPSPYAPRVSPGTAVAPPIRRRGGGYCWSLELIRKARDAQLRGEFCEPVRLAEQFRTDDALFTAYQTRVSTQSSVALEYRPVDSGRGREVAKRMAAAICAPTHVRESIHGTLANHGVAIGYVTRTYVDDPKYGPTVQMELTEWPLEHVRYNVTNNMLETRTRDNGTVTITHGDGRWIIFRKFGMMPWTQDACVLPAAFLWAAHAGGISDWALASASHGQPKLLGKPQQSLAMQKDDGTGALSGEAQGLLDTLVQLASGDAAAGVIPFGAEATLLFNGSTAWQVFRELILNREKAAMRIYLGTDAILGAQGGAPGVDVEALFNVASTRIQGDFEALERGYREGMLLPWAALHAVDPKDVPAYSYAMPDTDGARRSAQEADAIERLKTCIQAMKDSGLDVTQDTIDALVRTLQVSVPCALAAEETRVIPIALAPTDIAKVVRVREARAAQGLLPLGDERDDMTITQLDEKTKADAAAANAPTAPDGAPPPPDGAPAKDAPTPANGQ